MLQWWLDYSSTGTESHILRHLLLRLNQIIFPRSWHFETLGPDMIETTLEGEWGTFTHFPWVISSWSNWMWFIFRWWCLREFMWWGSCLIVECEYTLGMVSYCAGSGFLLGNCSGLRVDLGNWYAGCLSFTVSVYCPGLLYNVNVHTLVFHCCWVGMLHIRPIITSLCFSYWISATEWSHAH